MKIRKEDELKDFRNSSDFQKEKIILRNRRRFGSLLLAMIIILSVLLRYVLWILLEMSSDNEVTMIFVFIGIYIFHKKFVSPLFHIKCDDRNEIYYSEVRLLGESRILIESMISKGISFGVMIFVAYYFYTFPVPQEKGIFVDFSIFFTGGFLVGLSLALVDWWPLSRKYKKMTSST